MRAAASFLALLLAVAGAPCAAHAANSPAASSSPGASPASAQCELSDPGQSGVTLIDSFAHPIHDRATLRFLFLLENEPERSQRTIYARAAKGIDPALIDLLHSQVAKACAGGEISNRAVRAMSLVANRWSPWTFDSANFSDFAAQVLVAVAALAVADRLPPSAVDSALAPFDMTLERLSQPAATPPPIPSGCQANRDARVLVPTRPEYSAIARAQNLTGVFQTKTTLDDEGLVESVELFTDSAGEGLAAVALRKSTVISAGSSTFAPAIADCKAVGGTYVFRVEFSSR